MKLTFLSFTEMIDTDITDFLDEPVDEAEAQEAEAAEVLGWLEPVRNVSAEYPEPLYRARKAEFVKQIRERDPRTPEQRLRDEWEQEVRDTRRSDYPY